MSSRPRTLLTGQSSCNIHSVDDTADICPESSQLNQERLNAAKVSMEESGARTSDTIDFFSSSMQACHCKEYQHTKICKEQNKEEH